VGTIKSGSVASAVNCPEKRKAPPFKAKTWAMVAGGAVVGAVTVNATAHAILALVTLLATPSVALTAGMLGGGLLGWRYMRQHQEQSPSATVTTTAALGSVDNLERISGITATYAGRLHSAGVHTFAHLATLTPERVHLIIGPTYYDNLIQSARWIADARRFAEHGSTIADA
jgi:hypothetical protein